MHRIVARRRAAAAAAVAAERVRASLLGHRAPVRAGTHRQRRPEQRSDIALIDLWSIQGIIARRSLPTDSICLPCASSRSRLKFSAPARFSAIHSFANSPGLDVGQDLAHRLARLLGDHARAARHVAVLGRVRDRVAHPLEALLVHQVDDQLQLVQALEVREARVVAGLDQRLEAGLDQLGRAAAEHRLLAEQVGLALVLEGRLDDPGAAAADAARRRRAPGRARCRTRPGGPPSGTGRRGPPRTGCGPGGPGPFGATMPTSTPGGGSICAEVDREAVGEHQQVALADPVADLRLPDLGLALVGQQDHHHVAAARGVGDVEDLEPRAPRPSRATTSRAAGRRRRRARTPSG